MDCVTDSIVFWEVVNFVEVMSQGDGWAEVGGLVPAVEGHSPAAVHGLFPGAHLERPSSYLTVFSTLRSYSTRGVHYVFLLLKCFISQSGLCLGFLVDRFRLQFLIKSSRAEEHVFQASANGFRIERLSAHDGMSIESRDDCVHQFCLQIR